MDHVANEPDTSPDSAVKVAAQAAECLRSVATQAFGADTAKLFKTVVNDVGLPFLQLTDKAESNNRWAVDEGSAKKDVMKLQASCVVSQDEFLKANPQVKDIAKLDRTGEFKFRHATTGEVDSGWKIAGYDEKKKELTLQREYNQQVQPGKDHDDLVQLMPGVPESFGKKLDAKLAELPANVRQNLEKAGYKIIAASTITDALPGLKDLTPRGWPADTTFDNSDGTHDNVSRRIIAPMRYKPESAWEPVMRDEVVVHQIGHALDFANGFLSADKEFVDAYDKDIARVFNRNDPVVKYLSQPNGIGRQETFATLFGLVLTGPENESQREFLKRTFPETIAVVNRQIRNLR